MFREPPFQNFSPGLKVLALMMVMIVTFLIALALGVALSIPFFGMGFLDDIASVSVNSDPETIFALKYFQIVNQVGLFIAPAILFVVLTDNHFTEYLDLNKGNKQLSMLFGLIVIGVSMPFINWLVQINTNMHLPTFLSGVEKWMRESEDKAQELTDIFLATGTWGGFFVNMLMVGLLAAIGEEMIFRGILVKLFREWTGNIHWGVIIPASLFSALHLQFYGFFGRMILGIILGYLFVWSGSLWVPIFVHFFNNAIAVVVSFLDARGVTSTKLENFGTSENVGIIISSFLLMVFTMMMVYFHEKGYFKRKTPADF
jgi:membrane protease YdiL (CAAX protease family)